jgi:hypothetical protein
MQDCEGGRAAEHDAEGLVSAAGGCGGGDGTRQGQREERNDGESQCEDNHAVSPTSLDIRALESPKKCP